MHTTWADVFRGGVWASAVFAAEVLLIFVVGTVVSALGNSDSAIAIANGIAIGAGIALAGLCFAWFTAMIVSPLSYALGRALDGVRSRAAHAAVFAGLGFVIGQMVSALLTAGSGWAWNTTGWRYALVLGALTAIACGAGRLLADRRRPERGRPAHTGHMDEIAALYDTHGREVGRAPRSVIRRENLHHGATAVVVFNSAGEIHVHRRTATKDLYPGRRDFAAGGVLLAEEDPHAAAAHEAFEELGVTTPLVRIGEGDFTDVHTSYHGFLFWTVTDAPLTFQAEEVADGEWMTREALLTALAEHPDDFMPDTDSLLTAWLRDLPATPPT